MADTTRDHDAPAAPSSDASSPQPGSKRKKVARTALTLREKAIVKSFCEQKVTDCKARGELVPSQEVLRREVATQFGWSCGRSTLSKIISMDWKLLRSCHEGGEAPRNPNMKRRRRPLFPAFEADLVKFIVAHMDGRRGREGGSGATDQHQSVEADAGGNVTSVATNNGPQSSEGGEARRRPLTEALILEEAQRLKQVHGVTDKMLVLSVGWLARFKHRHCIRLRKPAGVSNKSSPPLHQQVGTLRGSSAGLGSMGAWSAGLIPPNVPDAHVASEQAMSHQSTTDSADNNENLLPSSSQQGDTLGLADSAEGGAPKTAALCSAQWHQGQSTKRSAVTAGLLAEIPNSIRELACSCQGSAVDDDFIRGVAGLRVAVVGFGSIVDAFLIAASVGPSGFVLCVEASPSNVFLAEQVAESFCLRKLGLPAVNMKFIVGDYSGIAQSSSSSKGDELKNLQGRTDLVICTCSIQSLEFPASKNVMLELAFSLLKVSGELRVTDLVCSRRLSSPECEEARLAVAVSGGGESAGMDNENSKQLQQKLLLNAPYAGDLKRLFRALSGDVEVRTESCSEAEVATIDVAGASLLPPLVVTNGVRFRRITFHVFRLQDVEDPREDYGQTAIFNGSDVGGKTAVGAELSYRLDDEWNFQRGVCTPIDGNTAQILQTSWLQQYFSVNGDRSRHRGPFVASAHTFSAASSVSSAPGTTIDPSEVADETVVDQSPLAMTSPSTEPLEVVNL
ncbi:hypothetical protein PHYPSEUDO_008724 [Phytophthora pseudosyringae]|uniref:HTH CENPB-type domain-containing protein n=1 Tax=Phytophthora pseudosyringae TaxID=221518 RepID=A0A8T1VGR2_9STRA|nr:hypothetical protein PHYPSEUDO_008724 [Phytophthora pseudosyringae]